MSGRIKGLGRTLFAAVVCVSFSSVVSASTVKSWSVRDELTRDSNPNGTWSFGRKWTLTTDSMDLFADRWDNWSAGGTGWYLGNAQWSPSVMDGVSASGPLSGPTVWAPYTVGDGYPVVRWTCPETGIYTINAEFWDINSYSGVNDVWVVVDGAIHYSGQINSDLEVARPSLTDLMLNAGEHVDFMASYVGGGTTSYGWVEIGAVVTQVPEPAMISILALGGLGLIRPRRD